MRLEDIAASFQESVIDVLVQKAMKAGEITGVQSVMVAGGVMVTLLGLDMLSGDSHSIVNGFKVMVERNQAQSGVWAEAVARKLGGGR